MELSHALPRGVIFDLGDVLFSWSDGTSVSNLAFKLKDILKTDTWFSYERGKITRKACCELVAQQLCLSPSDVDEALTQAHRSLRANDDLISLLRDLRNDGSVKVYAMSNIGREDFQDIATKMEWSLFDRVFTSSEAGKRKPELEFYSYVLDEIGLPGNQLLFIDDKRENVHAARSLGVRGLVFGESTVQVLRTMFDSPVGRAWKYLFRNAVQCHSTTDNGVEFTDNFSKLLVVDSLGDRYVSILQYLIVSVNLFNNFANQIFSKHYDWSQLGFPDDLEFLQR
jgi:HAD superfamily hydrolase (TIGR01509 family)